MFSISNLQIGSYIRTVSSATASDTIWWETVRAKEAGLPIVVSMGDYAARCVLHSAFQELHSFFLFC